MCKVIFFYWWLSQVTLSQLITFPVSLHLSPYSNNEQHVVFEWVFFLHITVCCCYLAIYSIQSLEVFNFISLLYSLLYQLTACTFSSFSLQRYNSAPERFWLVAYWTPDDLITIIITIHINIHTSSYKVRLRHYL